MQNCRFRKRDSQTSDSALLRLSAPCRKPLGTLERCSAENSPLHADPTALWTLMPHLKNILESEAGRCPQGLFSLMPGPDLMWPR